MYALTYQSRVQIDKKNRYGIHTEIEKRVLAILEYGIEASLTADDKKVLHIKKIRIGGETLKHLVRLEYEMQIINQKKYIALESILVELSKMALGWERHTTQKHHK